MKRLFDVICSLILSIIFIIPMIIIGILVKLTSTGPALHWSSRVGKDTELFNMPKFRTMFLETPDVATHLLENSKSYITPLGAILRKTSLDELPQLFPILLGKMSFVGPRPALFNQEELIQLREEKGINKFKTGLTGWAQINGRDDISNKEKVELDFYYLNNQSIKLDIFIIWRTFFVVLSSKNVKH